MAELVTLNDVLLKHIIDTQNYVSSSYLHNAIKNDRLGAEKIDGVLHVDMNEALAVLAEKGTRKRGGGGGGPRINDPDKLQAWILEHEDVIHRNSIRNAERQEKIDKLIPRWENITGESWEDHQSNLPTKEERLATYKEEARQRRAEKKATTKSKKK